MQEPTLRQNGKKEVTLKINFHFDLKELAIIAMRVFHSPDYIPKTQKKFEEGMRFYLYQSGCIDVDFN